MDKMLKKFYTDYLTRQLKDSKLIKENVTVNEYERFKKWIRQLDDKTITNIIKEGDIEDIITILVQGKGKDVPGLSGKSKRAKEIVSAVIEKFEVECKEKCADDRSCFSKCLIDKEQHIIGSLKTEKDKCRGWSQQKCYDRFDKVIEFVSNKVQTLTRELKNK